MEYTFGKNEQKQSEVLRTKGDTHTDMSGFCETVRKYPDCTITDSFFVVRKYHSDEDAEGNCYDWYTIDKHNRIIDRTPPLKETEALTLELAADHEERLCMMELGI